MSNEFNDKYVHGMDWANEDITLSNLANYRQFQYNLVSKYIGKRILEIGSGDRGFTNLIVKNNDTLERLLSIEPSKTLFERFERVYKFPENVEFQCLDLYDLEEKKCGKFDTIIFIHVLEHIESDLSALNKVHELLEDNGYVLIEVPAIQSLYSVHDEILGHYRRYNKKTILKAVDTSRYKIVKMFYSDIIGVLGSFIFFKLMKIKLNSIEGKELVSTQGRIYDKVIIPIQNLIEKFIHPPIGLNLTCILKKK